MGFAVTFPVIYIPVINDKVFLHAPITWEVRSSSSKSYASLAVLTPVHVTVGDRLRRRVCVPALRRILEALQARLLQACGVTVRAGHRAHTVIALAYNSITPVAENMHASRPCLM